MADEEKSPAEVRVHVRAVVSREAESTILLVGEATARTCISYQHKYGSPGSPGD